MLQKKATSYLNAVLDQEDPPRPPGAPSGLSMYVCHTSAGADRVPCFFLLGLQLLACDARNS
jgi:hypothetical protein